LGFFLVGLASLEGLLFLRAKPISPDSGFGFPMTPLLSGSKRFQEFAGMAEIRALPRENRPTNEGYSHDIEGRAWAFVSPQWGQLLLS
jgi:hypothetical protein